MQNPNYVITDTLSWQVNPRGLPYDPIAAVVLGLKDVPAVERFHVGLDMPGIVPVLLVTMKGVETRTTHAILADPP